MLRPRRYRTPRARAGCARAVAVASGTRSRASDPRFAGGYGRRGNKDEKRSHKLDLIGLKADQCWK